MSPNDPYNRREKKTEVIKTDWWDRVSGSYIDWLILRQGFRQSTLWTGVCSRGWHWTIGPLCSVQFKIPHPVCAGGWTQSFVSPRQVLYWAPDCKAIFKVMKPLRDWLRFPVLSATEQRQHTAASQTCLGSRPCSFLLRPREATSLFPHPPLKQTKGMMGGPGSVN